MYKNIRFFKKFKNIFNSLNHKAFLIFVLLIIIVLTATTVIFFARGKQYTYHTIPPMQDKDKNLSGNDMDNIDNNRNSEENQLKKELEKKFIEKFETYTGLDWEKYYKFLSNTSYMLINSYLFTGAGVFQDSDYTNEIIRLLNYRDSIHDYFALKKTNSNQFRYTSCKLESVDRLTILDMPVKDYNYLLNYAHNVPYINDFKEGLETDYASSNKLEQILGSNANFKVLSGVNNSINYAKAVLYSLDSTQRYTVNSINFYGSTYDPFSVNYTVDKYVDGHFEAAEFFRGNYYFWFNSPELKFEIQDNNYVLIYDKNEDFLKVNYIFDSNFDLKQVNLIVQNSNDRDERIIMSVSCNHDVVSFDEIKTKFNQIYSQLENQTNFRSYNFDNLDEVKYYNLSEVVSEFPFISINDNPFLYQFNKNNTKYDKYLGDIYNIQLKGSRISPIKISESSSLYINSIDYSISYNPNGVGLMNSCGTYTLFLEGFGNIELECNELHIELSEEYKNRLISENKSFHSYRIKTDISKRFGYQPANIYIYPKSYEAQKKLEERKIRLKLLNTNEVKNLDEKYRNIIIHLYNANRNLVFNNISKEELRTNVILKNDFNTSFSKLLEPNDKQKNCYAFFDNVNKFDVKLFNVLEIQDIERYFLKCATGISNGYQMILQYKDNDEDFFDVYVIYSNEYVEKIVNFYVNSDLYKKDQKIRGMQYKKLGDMYIFIYSDKAKEKVTEVLNDIQLVE